MLELKDKLGVVAAWEAASAEHAPTPEQSQANEAVLALIALGYKQVDAHKTVRDLQEREPSIKTAEELVKSALKNGGGKVGSRLRRNVQRPTLNIQHSTEENAVQC